jgi:hypothetical protein
LVLLNSMKQLNLVLQSNVGRGNYDRQEIELFSKLIMKAEEPVKINRII